MANESILTERKLVRDLMTVGVPTCPPTTPIVDLTRLMLEKNWEAVVVLDGEEGHAIGVVGQDELVKAYEREDVRTLTAEQVMHEGVPTIPPDILLTAAAQMMLDQHVRALFLMHNAGRHHLPGGLHYLSAHYAAPFQPKPWRRIS